MKLASTSILRVSVLFVGLAAMALCLVGLPILISRELSGDFDFGYIFLGMYVAAIPFFIALLQSLKLLKYIDKNEVFSERSVAALKYIKTCALVICGLFTLGMPYIFYLADLDDAPGLVAIGLILIGASFIIATSSAMFQNLLQTAIYLKAENDLTV